VSKRGQRKAQSLEQASRNPDGSYNGARALAWLSGVLFPGNGLSEEDVRQIAKEVQEQRSKSKE
jgi:tRNA U34 2-thiouridine synthase MnmA/TrmU